MPYVDDLANVIDMDAIRAAGLQARRRPARRRRRCTTGSRSPSATAWTSTVVNPAVDPTFSFMTRRSRRQDPHGLLQPLRDGQPGRAQGPLRRRLRQRPRLRPPRHRHAVGRADEPEPLPGRRDPLPAHAPPGLAGGRGGRQDAGQQQHDRPRGGTSSAGGSSRCRSASSGSRRACSTAPAASAARRAPAPASCAATARVWTTDKDGPIMDLLAAEITARTGKDPGEHYRELTRGVRHAVLHAHRRPGHARAEGRARASSSPEAVTAADAGRRADHRQADARPRQRRRRSAA